MSLLIQWRRVTTHAQVFKLRKQLVVILALVLMAAHTSAQASQGGPQQAKNTADQMLRSAARVNPSTLALELSIPLQTLPGRNGVNVPSGLSYSSKVWQMDYSGHSGLPPQHPGWVTPRYAEETIGGWSDSLRPPWLDLSKMLLWTFNSQGDSDPCPSGHCLEPPPTPTPTPIIGDPRPPCTPPGCHGCTDFESLFACTHPGGLTAAPTANSVHRIIYRIFAHLPDGSIHELRKSDTPINVQDLSALQMDGTYWAIDGSNLRLEYTSSLSAPDILYFPDGARYTWSFENNPQSGTLETVVRYLDAEGNMVSLLPAWKDTLGRSVTAILPDDPTPGTPQTYAVPGWNGTPQNYTLRWERLAAIRTPINPAAPASPVPDLHYTGGAADCTGSGDALVPALFTQNAVCAEEPVFFNPILLHEIGLPNGQKYRLTYNQYGELDKIVYPGGGYERFRFARIAPVQGAHPAYIQTNRGVVERWISYTGSTQDEAHWAYNTEAAGNTGALKVTTTAPDHTFTEPF